MTDRANRAVLAALGLALVGAAVAGLLAWAGIVGLGEPSVLYGRLADAAARNRVAWSVGVAVGWVAAVVVGAVAAWAQLSPEGRGGRPDDMVLGEDARGRTTVRAEAAAGAVAHDLGVLPDVVASTARLVAAGERPHLVVRLDVAGDADLAGLRAGAEDVYDRVAGVLGVEGVRVDAVIRLVPRSRARVH
ncbi:MAG: hypothetical protein ACRDZ9_06930 [Acidimicrobiales bacterium]